MTKAKQSARQEAAIAKLRETLKPGDTLYTILRHVSRSGMQRRYSIVIVDKRDGRIFEISGWVALAIEYKRDSRDGGIYAYTYSEITEHLSAVLFNDEYVSKRCTDVFRTEVL